MNESDKFDVAQCLKNYCIPSWTGRGPHHPSHIVRDSHHDSSDDHKICMPCLSEGAALRLQLLMATAGHIAAALLAAAPRHN
jgi:hypothetical protein